ncbi:MAG TPA: translation initiation factor IF-2 associated domain-containing protein, partial [Ensifer sp.]|uniref:translation initiation factor IF-2 associated domain-containing protein n=1 Tax=Ensifer sp. TaxID=1872086 RepID=UPI002E1040DC|nr:translation initiation factor IF-2 associated domain-containing protein [Ensifer sp.]
MTDNNDDKTGGAAGKKTLTLKPHGVSQGTVRQDMGRGRTKAVVVETKKRPFHRPKDERPITPVAAAPAARPADQRPAQPQPSGRPAPQPQQHSTRQEANQANRPRVGVVLNQLSAGEIDARRRALAEAQIRDAEEAVIRAENEARRKREEEARLLQEKEEAARRAAEEAARAAAEPEAKVEEVAEERPVAARAPASPERRVENRPQAPRPAAPAGGLPTPAPAGALRGRKVDNEKDDDRGPRPGAGPARGKVVRPEPAKVPARPKGDDGRRQGKLTLSTAADEDAGQRARSLSA